jgi:hypothetical protein
MQSMTGTITIVQELRFLLRGDDGRHKLFLLSSGDPIDWRALHALTQSGERVLVYYDDVPYLSAARAQSIELKKAEANEHETTHT